MDNWIDMSNTNNSVKSLQSINNHLSEQSIRKHWSTYEKRCGNCFVDVTPKDMFDLLYQEIRRPEKAAMGSSTLPAVLDKLCMIANINTRKLIETIREEKI